MPNVALRTPGRTRTFNLSIRNRTRYPLRHRGLVSMTGVEPAHPVMGASSSSWCVCHSATPTYKSGPGRNRTDLSWASTERLNQFSFGTIPGERGGS